MPTCYPTGRPASAGGESQAVGRLGRRDRSEGSSEASLRSRTNAETSLGSASKNLDSRAGVAPALA